MRAILFSAVSALVVSVASTAAAQPAVDATVGGEVAAEGGAEAGGQVVAETAPAPVLGGPGESCQARSDCGEGLGCVQQVCTDPNQGKACGATSECGGTLRCIENVCGGPDPKDKDDGEDGADGAGADGGDGEGAGMGADMPVPYVKRPLTLPAMTLAPELGFAGTHLSFGGFGGDVFGMDFGLAFGILDDLQIEAKPLNVQFGDPDFDYGAFRVAALYRFLNTEVVEMGAELRFYLDNGANFILNPGMPVRIHGGDIVRVDTGINFGLVVANNRSTFGNDVTFGIHDLDQGPFPAIGPWMAGLSPQAGVPVDVAFQIVDFFWAGLGTGFGLLSFEDAGDTIFVPLGLEAGGTIPGDRGPMADIGAGFQFPLFVQSGGGDAIVTEIWQFGIDAKVYIGL